MANTLEGKKIIVIGGTSGIGFATAKHSLLNLASEVIVASSTQAKVDSTVQRLQAVIAEHKLKGSVSGAVLDASKADGVKAFFKNVGELDHLVWTSGAVQAANLKDTSIEEAKGIFNLRFWGVVAAAQSATIRPGGSITLSTGQTIRKPQPGWSILTGAAGSVDALTRGLAVDLAPIRVNIVSPGLVKTELWDSAGFPKEAQEQMEKQYSETLPVKFVAGADDVVEAYLFCMKCKYLTGQRIEVDGGLVLI